MKYISISILFIIICSCNEKVKESNTTETKEVVVKEKKTKVFITKDQTIEITYDTRKENNVEEPEETMKIKENQHANLKSLSYSEISNLDSITDTNSIAINEKCALSIIPSSRWIKVEQERMGEDGWMTIVEDNTDALDYGRQSLIKNDIKFIKELSREKRYVRFMNEDKIISIIDLQKMEDAWGIILFNGNDTPDLWNGFEIEEDMKFVYKK
ncbi:hypothetical protein [Flammeovirga agarivorans]|uniref:Lipoprotein n=1 Tax=Flammeovirga agarivorans TaxID=2726742 RepID=A0A7X8SRR2_9BACT|nr:hypothetical protein [Flammeovirga agarivorans]NLR95063.1 hypothetical protein [Flammeovirga agarivorans]